MSQDNLALACFVLVAHGDQHAASRISLNDGYSMYTIIIHHITSPSAILFSRPFQMWLCEYWSGGSVDRWRWSRHLIPDWIGEELCHFAVPKRKSRHHYCLEENHEQSGWITSNNKCQNLSFFLQGFRQSMWIFPFVPLKHNDFSFSAKYNLR